MEADGFIEPFIRIYEGKILDGWHRYRAAQELNLIRKLKFQEWDEDERKDGDPKAFVLARNIERRHLTPRQRAQIVVHFNERFGMGRPSESSPDGELKSRQELAAEAGVGTSTIDRAITVEKAGQSAAVISGDKTPGQIEKEEVLEQLYQNRQDFQTAVSDFAQSGSYLNFTYCRRRIKSLVGLEDSTDEGSTDYTQWDLQKIKAQSQIADESVLVIKGYLNEDPKIEGHPVAALLSEMQRIHEIRQSAKLDTYTRPFLIGPLSDAVEKIEKLWTSDWEAKSAEERLDDLNKLEACLPSLIEAEDTARAASKINADPNNPNNLAETAYFAARCEIEKIVSDMGIDLQNFYAAATDAHKLSDSGIFNPPDDIRSTISSASLFNGWCEILKKIHKDFAENANWVLALALEQAKIDHANARRVLQSAFFETDLHDRMTDFEDTDTGGKLKKFFAMVVDIKTPKLRFNIFTPDEFFFDTRGDAEHDFSEQSPEMYRGRDLTVSEIRDEIEVLRSITKDIRWYMQDDERHLGWMEQVVEAIAPKLEDVRENFLDARDALLSAIAETGITCIDFLDAASNYFMGSKRNRPYRICMKPVEHFKDWSVFNFTSWTADIKMLHADLENNADWVLALNPQVEKGIDRASLQGVVSRARLRFWRARERLSDFGRVTPIEFAKEAVKSLGLTEDATQYLFEGTEDPLLDLPVSGLTCWQSRLFILTTAIEKQSGWVEVLYPTEPDAESSKTALSEENDEQIQHTLVAIERLKTGLKKFHVIDSEAFADDILQFYNGVDLSELSTSPQETLKNISDFIEGFVNEPLQTWPEYIRNHRWMPKRELVLVSIGISNNTDDEFEEVEFTDESSDVIRCDLNELPEDIRTALLKIASEKIYAEAVKEFHTDG